MDAVALELGPAGRWLHYGLGTSDVVDTALALQVREAGAPRLEELERAQEAVISRAQQHKDDISIGRTHGVHAEPTTFGLKLAGWAFELDRGRERLARALEGMRVGKLSGAVGTYAATDPELERLACERLGLEPAPVSPFFIQRDRHADLLAALALVAASLERFALEIRHLARTEVAEVEEPFGKGQKGSSASAALLTPIVPAFAVISGGSSASRLGLGAATGPSVEEVCAGEDASCGLFADTSAMVDLPQRSLSAELPCPQPCATGFGKGFHGNDGGAGSAGSVVSRFPSKGV